jgi:hypothetical protein
MHAIVAPQTHLAEAPHAQRLSQAVVGQKELGRLSISGHGRIRLGLLLRSRVLLLLLGLLLLLLLLHSCVGGRLLGGHRPRRARHAAHLASLTILVFYRARPMPCACFITTS